MENKQPDCSDSFGIKYAKNQERAFFFFFLNIALSMTDIAYVIIVMKKVSSFM